MHRSGWLLLSLCAGSLVTHTGGLGNRKLCGIQLVEALLVVSCFYQPGRRVLESISKFHESSGFFFFFFNFGVTAVVLRDYN